MNEPYLGAVGIHRIQPELVVNKLFIHATSSASTQNEDYNGSEVCENIKFPVGSSVVMRWYF